MAVKILYGILAIVLMVGYLGIAVIKLKEISLAVVGLISIGMMAWDMWDDLKKKED